MTGGKQRTHDVPGFTRSTMGQPSMVFTLYMDNHQWCIVNQLRGHHQWCLLCTWTRRSKNFIVREPPKKADFKDTAAITADYNRDQTDGSITCPIRQGRTLQTPMYQ